MAPAPGSFLVVALAALFAVFGSAASAAEPEPDGVGLVDGGIWWLDGTTTGGFYYGNPGDMPMMGDWDCDGIDTPGVYRSYDSTVYLRNSNTIGTADWWYMFGNPGDLAVAGDFDGDGCDSVWLYRPSEQRLYVTGRTTAKGDPLGSAELWFDIGNEGDRPVVGDLDGDGTDEIGLYRPTEGRVYYWMGTPGGAADGYWTFGYPFDQLIAGDWTQQGLETLGAFRPLEGRFHLSAGNGAPVGPDLIIEYGGPGLKAVSGRFGVHSTGGTRMRIRDAFSMMAVLDPQPSVASGDGCLVPQAGTEVDIVFNSSAGSRVVASLPVADDGTWSGEFLVPFDIPRGDYQVTAVCKSTGEARLTYLARSWEPNEHWSVSSCGAPVWEGGPWWMGPVIGQWIVDHWGLPEPDWNPQEVSVSRGFRQGGWIMALGREGLWTWTPDGDVIPTFVFRTLAERISWMTNRPSAEEFLTHIQDAVPALPAELASCLVATGEYSLLP